MAWCGGRKPPGARWHGHKAWCALPAVLLIVTINAGRAAAIPGASPISVSIWAGGGHTIHAGTGHAMAALQAGVPLIPIAVRGELMLDAPFSGHGGADLIADVLLKETILVVEPYLIGGVGRYRIGTDHGKSGVNAGAGLRAGLGRLGAFAEIRRHAALSATIVTVGVTF